MGKRKNTYIIAIGIISINSYRQERYHLEDLGVDGRIIIKCTFKKRDGTWTGLIFLRIGTGGKLL